MTGAEQPPFPGQVVSRHRQPSRHLPLSPASSTPCRPRRSSRRRSRRTRQRPRGSLGASAQRDPSQAFGICHAAPFQFPRLPQPRPTRRNCTRSGRGLETPPATMPNLLRFLLLRVRHAGAGAGPGLGCIHAPSGTGIGSSDSRFQPKLWPFRQRPPANSRETFPGSSQRKCDFQVETGGCGDFADGSARLVVRQPQ